MTMTKKKVTGWVARQGDVLVMRIEKQPKGDYVEVSREQGSVVLAHGEVTGHMHQIREPGVCLLRAEGISDRVLSVGVDLANLVHEEHGTIPLERGKYLVRIQREWSLEDDRQVID
jgi:hypothetical protein